MKKIFVFLLIILLLLTGCMSRPAPAQIAATTLPVYEFTARLCEGTPITVTRLVTEEVSCLHDYSLNVKQVKAAEAAEIIVISGVHKIAEGEKVKILPKASATNAGGLL